MERLNPIKIICEGGLDLRQSLITTRQGAALDLTNFEPNLHGGYRRLSGFRRVNGAAPGCISHFVPIFGYSGGGAP